MELLFNRDIEAEDEITRLWSNSKVKLIFRLLNLKCEDEWTTETLQSFVRKFAALKSQRRRREGHPLPRVQAVWRHKRQGRDGAR